MPNDLQILPRTVSELPAVIQPPVSVPPVNAMEYSVHPQAGSLLDYWTMIWRRKLLLAGCMLAGLVVAMAVMLPQAPVYRARTTLEVKELNHGFVDMRLTSPVEEGQPSDSLTDIQTQIKILQSDTLIDRALKNAQIVSADALEPQIADTTRWAGFLRLPVKPAPNETLAHVAGRNLKAGVAGQSRIVEITFDAPNPDLAARFANALTRELIDQNTETRWQMNRQTSSRLAGQLSDLRGQLDKSEKALQDYARRQSLIYTGDRQNVSEEKLRQVQAALSAAQAERMTRQSRFEAAQSTRVDALPEIINDPTLRTLETNLTDLQQKQADVSVTFTGDYPKAKKLQAEIDSLKDAIKQKRTDIIGNIASDLTAAERREELLSSAYATQAMRVSSDAQKSIQYDDLKREVDTNRQIYEGMLQRVKEATIASAIKTSNVRVLDPAIPPLRPFKPNVPAGSAIGLLSGAAFGVLMIVLRTRTDERLKEPGDAGVLLGVPELGVIPRARTGRKTVPALTVVAQNRLIEGAPALPSAGSLEVADSFRAVLTSIILGGVTQQQRVLVITSALPGEGKTSTAANLAITLANMKRKVLLIDGDIRNPRIHRIFALDNSTGVTNMVKASGAQDGVAHPAIQATASPGLFILTSGPVAEGDADLLFSSELTALIEKCREQFDMVLIDTPPVLSIPDARVLGRIADAVVLVARAGKTSRAAIQAAFQRLVEDRTKILGIILNDWNSRHSPYGYYGGYRYGAAGAAPVRTSAQAK